MVSGRKSDRKRKNIVFGKIPQKILVVEKIFGHRNFFDGRKFFDRHLENFSSPNKIFFYRKFFQRRKKNVDRFFWQSFFFVQKQVSDNFFFDLIFRLLCKNLVRQIHYMGLGTCWGESQNEVQQFVCRHGVWARWQRNTWSTLTKLSESLV